jgi:hypothetical protein
VRCKVVIEETRAVRRLSVLRATRWTALFFLACCITKECPSGMAQLRVHGGARSLKGRTVEYTDQVCSGRNEKQQVSRVWSGLTWRWIRQMQMV